MYVLCSVCFLPSTFSRLKQGPLDHKGSPRKSLVRHLEATHSINQKFWPGTSCEPSKKVVNLPKFITTWDFANVKSDQGLHYQRGVLLQVEVRALFVKVKAKLCKWSILSILKEKLCENADIILQSCFSCSWREFQWSFSRIEILLEF